MWTRTCLTKLARDTVPKRAAIHFIKEAGNRTRRRARRCNAFSPAALTSADCTHFSFPAKLAGLKQWQFRPSIASLENNFSLHRFSRIIDLRFVHILIANLVANNKRFIHQFGVARPTGSAHAQCSLPRVAKRPRSSNVGSRAAMRSQRRYLTLWRAL